MSEMMNSKAEINTNMTMVELKGKVVKDLTDMNQEEKDFAISSIKDFIIGNGYPGHLMLLSNELRYYTLFKIGASANEAAKEIFNFLMTEDYFKNLGGIKLIDVCGDHVEVWAGDKFFALFDFDGFIVEV